MKMKKTFTFVTAVAMLFALVASGCKFSNDVDARSLGRHSEPATKWSDLTENRPRAAKELDRVGAEHNRMLGEVYSELVSFKDAQARTVSGKKGLSDEDIAFVMNRYFSGTSARAVTDVLQSSTEDEAFVFSPEAQTFVDGVRTLIDPITTETPRSEVDAVLKQIETIEKQAETVVLPEERDPFYAYTATSRASLAYWYDNLGDWDNLREGAVQAERAIGFWRKVGACVASDAGGAIAGWKKGGELAEKLFPGNTKVKLAAQIIGSAAVGVASSAEGWRTGSYIVVTPIDLLKEKIKQITG